MTKQVETRGQDQAPGNFALDGQAVLPAPLYKAFIERSFGYRARKGELIFASGAEADDVFLIRSGKVKLVRSSATVREVLLRNLGPGRIFGEMTALDGQPRSGSVLAVEDCDLNQMPGEEFRRFLREVPEAGLWMARQLAVRIRNLSKNFLELATMPVSGRVQAQILRLAADVPAENDCVRIAPMPTHAELAARIGSNREAVSRELGQLARDGLIRQSGRTLEILALDRLKAAHARFTS